MENLEKNHPEWVARGKSIRQLIKELQSFENQDLEVRISIDYGDSHQPISLVEKAGGYCLLISCVSFYDNHKNGS